MIQTQQPYVTVRDAIGDLPEPGDSDVARYEFADDRYYRDACGPGIWLPKSEYMLRKHEEPDIPEPSGTSISMFSGCGGFDLGTTMAGFETRAFIEMDASAVQTIMHNAAAVGWLDAAIFNCDIRRISVQQLLFAARLERGECDLVTGGFPCQPFSTSGRRQGTKDARGNLFYECSRIIEGVQPRTFLLENVPGLLTSNGGADIAAICTEFERVGYGFAVMVLNAVDYGVPQDRRRVFFIGLRPDVGPAIGGVEALAESIINGATHYDPDTGMPSFAPLFRWDGQRLVQQNEPLTGQISGSVNAAKHRRATAERNAPQTLFEAARQEGAA